VHILEYLTFNVLNVSFLHVHLTVCTNNNKLKPL